MNFLNKSFTPRNSNALFSFSIALFALSLASISAPAQAENQDDDMARVVFHADYADPRRFSAMLTSINNMVNHYENEFIDFDVRIVFVAHGIRFLTADKLTNTPFAADSALEERRDNLKGRLMALSDVHEVKLELCDITRSQIKLEPGKLYKNVVGVPSGVIRIAELQQKGFAYIKVE